MTIRDKVYETVASTLATSTKREESDITPGTNMKSDLGVTSINLVEIQAVVQDKYEALISFAKLNRCETIDELVAEIVEAIQG